MMAAASINNLKLIAIPTKISYHASCYEKIIPALLVPALVGFLAAPLQAGTEVYKQVAPPPPQCGLGFCSAIDMGANVFQDRGTERLQVTTALTTQPIGILMPLWRFLRRMTSALAASNSVMSLARA
jgi:hypothetical protein